LGICHDWGSIKQEYLFYYSSVIIVRKRSLLQNYAKHGPSAPLPILLGLRECKRFCLELEFEIRILEMRIRIRTTGWYGP